MKRTSILVTFCLLLLVSATLLYSRDFFFNECVNLEHYIQKSGNAGPIWFILISAIGIAFIPRTSFLILAGFFFGTWYGTLYAFIASLITSVSMYFFAKSKMSDTVERLLRQTFLMNKLNRLSLRHGFAFAFLARNAHLHFGIVNLACGILPMRFRDYFWGSFFGLLPGTLGICYAASVFGCSLLDRNAKMPQDLAWKIGLGSLLLTGVSLIPLIFDKKNKT